MIFSGLLLTLSSLSAQLPPPPLVDAQPEGQWVSAPPLVNADVPLPTVGTEVNAPEELSRPPLLGVGLDVGAPDGAGVAAYVRLFRFLEVHGGVAHNGVSAGLRGGVTFLPVDRWFVPTLTLEVGDHPGGDANPVARFFTGNDGLNVPQLQDVGYGYQSALLGFEFGSREHYAIFLRGGVTRVSGHARTAQVVGTPTATASNVTTGNVDVDLTLPAAKLGFALYFF